MKTGQQVHPRTIITFVQEVLSGITQYYRTVGNIWDTLYLKHQLRESNLTLDRVYAMLAEFLIELRLHEEQDKITQIVTGSSTSVKHSMYDEYINASKGKVPAKGKGKQRDDYWKPGGCSQGHNCPKVSSETTARSMCAICGSTKHVTSQCTRPVKPKAKNAEWMSLLAVGKTLNGRMINGRQRSMRRLKVRKVREKGLSPRANLRGRLHRGPLLQGRHSLHRQRMSDPPNPNPNLKHVPA